MSEGSFSEVIKSSPGILKFWPYNISAGVDWRSGLNVTRRPSKTSGKA